MLLVDVAEFVLSPLVDVVGLLVPEDVVGLLLFADEAGLLGVVVLFPVLPVDAELPYAVEENLQPLSFSN